MPDCAFATAVEATRASAREHLPPSPMQLRMTRVVPDILCGVVLAALATVVVTRFEPPSIVAADLDRDGIRRAVTEQFVPAARRCYNELLRRDPVAEGRVTLRFGVVRDRDRGVVDRCEVVDAESEIADPGFRGCLVDAMKTVVFDAPSENDRVQIVYPILFRR